MTEQPSSKRLKISLPARIEVPRLQLLSRRAIEKYAQADDTLAQLVALNSIEDINKSENIGAKKIQQRLNLVLRIRRRFAFKDNTVLAFKRLLPAFRHLDISDGSYIFEEIISACTNLTSLDVSNSPISSETLLTIISNNPRIHTLLLKRCLWISTETVLRAISQLNLHTLSLAGTGTRVDVARVLHALAARPIVALDCADWPLLTVLELRDIARMTKLQQLDLSGLRHCSGLIHVFKQCKELRELRLNHANVDDDAIQQIIHHCKQLRVLEVNGADNLVTKNTLLSLPEKCPNLRVLGLYRQHYCDDFVVENLLRFCKDLEELDISQTAFSGLSLSSEHHQHDKLRVLKVMECPHLAWQAVSNIRAVFPHLTSLQLSRATAMLEVS